MISKRPNPRLRKPAPPARSPPPLPPPLTRRPPQLQNARKKITDTAGNLKHLNAKLALNPAACFGVPLEAHPQPLTSTTGSPAACAGIDAAAQVPGEAQGLLLGHFQGMLGWAYVIVGGLGGYYWTWGFQA